MKRKIMIVDDEVSVVELLKEIFEQEGFEVLYTYSCKECLEILKSVLPDLLLVDMMKHFLIDSGIMNGLELIERLKENPRTKDIKIVVISSVRNPKMLQEFERLGVEDFIAKPFNNIELVDTVKRLIGM